MIFSKRKQICFIIYYSKTNNIAEKPHLNTNRIAQKKKSAKKTRTKH